MKNITIAIDDETHRAARIRAAELGTSVSALVKAYLRGLAEGAPPPAVSGVRDMQTSFKAEPAPAGETLPPGAYGRTPDGKPYFTKDGKPRKPGAMRHLIGDGWTEDFDSWPDGFIDAMYGEDTEAANNWWKPFAKPPAKREP
jgi:plasmid stability protein